MPLKQVSLWLLPQWVVALHGDQLFYVGRTGAVSLLFYGDDDENSLKFHKID
jgi:hypothetical protein